MFTYYFKRFKQKFFLPFHGRHRRNKKSRYKKNKPAAFVLAGLILLTAVVFAFFEKGIEPYIYDDLSSYVKNCAMLEIGKTVQQMLNDNKTEYSDIAKLNTDSQGNVTAVTVGALAVNEIKNGISASLSENALQNNYYEYKVPIGNLSKSLFFSGRGPNLKIKSILSNFVVSDVESVFESAGINQTRHSIYLVISADISTQVLLYKAEDKLTTRVLIAETVIVGSVPASYFRD